MERSNQIGICAWSLPIEGPYACKLAADLGFQGIQLDIGSHERGFPLSKKVLQEAYLEMAEQHSITFPSIAVRELDYYALTAENGSREAVITREAIAAAVQAANDMGIEMVMIPSFEKSSIDHESDFKRTVNALQEACDLAELKGIQIATENLLGIKDMQRLFTEVDRNNLRLFFDTQNHFLHKGHNIAFMIEQLYPFFCSQIHVKDGKDGALSGALLGQGDAGVFESVDTLKRLGFNGWYISENYYDCKPLSSLNPDPVEIIKQDISILKQVISI